MSRIARLPRPEHVFLGGGACGKAKFCGGGFVTFLPSERGRGPGGRIEEKPTLATQRRPTYNGASEGVASEDAKPQGPASHGVASERSETRRRELRAVVGACFIMFAACCNNAVFRATHYATPAGVRIYFDTIPGVAWLRHSTTGLPYTAPHRGSRLRCCAATPRLVIRLCIRSAPPLVTRAEFKAPWGDRSIAGGAPASVGVAPGKAEKDTGAPIVGDRGHGYNTSRCFLPPTTGL